jgi:fumarylacetoacetase
MFDIDDTHDASLHSWVASANQADTDFPIQNLPLGRFRAHPRDAWSIGVAIGDQVLDLRKAGLIDHQDMNLLMAQPLQDRQTLRRRISQGLRQGTESNLDEGRSKTQSAFEAALLPMSRVELGLPCHIGDYSDFYIGIHHATAVGRLFRPDSPLLPNYKWVPIGYHGRASTVVPSGTPFVRPQGQIKGPQDEQPRHGATQRLDFELELGLFVGQGNAMGQPVTMHDAESHLFGIALFNDWSARDIQAWEYQPLGPFLSKSFASTISPWIVTMEALAPFRRAFARPTGDPLPLPYLTSERNQTTGAIDIALQVHLQTQSMREKGQAGERISQSNFADAAYWTAAQLVAHHTVNGCALNSGDLFGSGTLSGPELSQSGSMLELSQGGKEPIELGNGEKRTFLHDGDTVTFTGRCSKAGFRSIGFGRCEATVLAPLQV